MKIPRGLSAEDLIKALSKFNYRISRQKGSHIRLSAIINSQEFHITIPNHSPLKIGTLNNILSEVALQNKISKEEVVKKLS